QPTAAINGQQLAAWLALPGDDAADIDFRVDGASRAASAHPLIANNPGNDAVTLFKPQHNQAFAERAPLAVDYDASDANGEFRVAEIALFDFDRALLARTLLTAPRGRAVLRLPALAEQQNLFVRVRAYYGESQRYVESEAGIRVYPDVSTPSVGIAGLAPRV